MNSRIVSSSKSATAAADDESDEIGVPTRDRCINSANERTADGAYPLIIVSTFLRLYIYDGIVELEKLLKMYSTRGILRNWKTKTRRVVHMGKLASAISPPVLFDALKKAIRFPELRSRMRENLNLDSVISNFYGLLKEHDRLNGRKKKDIPISLTELTIYPKGSLQFSCSYCDRKFRTPGPLKLHESAHECSYHERLKPAKHGVEEVIAASVLNAIGSNVSPPPPPPLAPSAEGKREVVLPKGKEPAPAKSAADSMFQKVNSQLESATKELDRKRKRMEIVRETFKSAHAEGDLEFMQKVWDGFSYVFKEGS
jgi:hypothetical protein